jgi:hypothetical protein
MPRGPKGERRPADVIGAAIMVAKIATGEIEDDFGKAADGEVCLVFLSKASPSRSIQTAFAKPDTFQSESERL